MSARKSAALFAAASLSIAGLAACSGASTPEVTTPAATSESPEPTQTVAEEATTEAATAEPTETATSEAPAATSGSREAPMAIGETRKVVDGSAFTVGMTSSNLDAAEAISSANEYHDDPADGETFIVGTVAITIDGEAIKAQGFEFENEGIDPYMALTFSYVAADGTSYDGTSGTTCFTGSPLYSQGALYSDGATQTGDLCFAVPSDKVAGGLWRIANGQNDSVWIASS